VLHTSKVAGMETGGDGVNGRDDYDVSDIEHSVDDREGSTTPSLLSNKLNSTVSRILLYYCLRREAYDGDTSLDHEASKLYTFVKHS